MNLSIRIVQLSIFNKFFSEFNIRLSETRRLFTRYINIFLENRGGNEEKLVFLDL